MNDMIKLDDKTLELYLKQMGQQGPINGVQYAIEYGLSKGLMFGQVKGPLPCGREGNQLTQTITGSLLNLLL